MHPADTGMSFICHWFITLYQILWRGKAWKTGLHMKYVMLNTSNKEIPVTKQMQI